MKVMMPLAEASLLLLLALLSFVCIRGLLAVALSRRTVRWRLLHVRRAAAGERIAGYLSRFRFVHGHLADLLESTRYRISIPAFMTGTVVLLLLGLSLGVFVFVSVKGVVTASLILASMPYLVLRLRLINLHMKTRLDFLPAIELFYQYYVMTPSKNIRNVVRASIAENRIRHPMKPIFEQLHRNLSTDRPVDDCIRIFTMSLGHAWAEYFAGIMRIGLAEGIDVSENLHDLIADMRKAQLLEQRERNRMLEIRIASFSPIFFLGIFLFVNFQINYENAYRYYLIDAGGRNMLLDALLLIFASLLLGIYLSMRRM
ncbi:hypothetical protein [Paenibacillus contaminans]|uniref:Type II secretion system protein GspF domain-containing protein n=1 Tax=Paenibacillus contaminans TaxID=450362 RepID=A0A329MH81_9BACL|nr:hypothetical protein [Paenibacillus contaminans]RAV16717.1 hypothetical protein DQG23_28180 [Paenibacillus contaminans]